MAAKWFLNDEELTEAATRVLFGLLANKIELHAPILLQYEIANALSKAQRRSGRPISTDMCIEAYKTFQEYPILFHHLDDKNRLEALEFANHHRRSFFDSAYLWLAIKLDCRWLTAEKRFNQALPAQFPVKHIFFLEQY